jgi:hypothetical protein
LQNISSWVVNILALSGCVLLARTRKKKKRSSPTPKGEVRGIIEFTSYLVATVELRFQ